MVNIDIQSQNNTRKATDIVAFLIFVLNEHRYHVQFYCLTTF